MPASILRSAAAVNRQHRRFAHVTAAVLGSLTVLFCALAALLWQDIKLEKHLRTELRGAYTYRRDMRAFLSKLQAGESSERGYLLTGDETYLKPFDLLVMHRAEDITHLRDAAAAEGWNTDQTALMGKLSEQRLDDMAQTVRLRRTGDATAAVALVRTNHGKQLMDQIRALATRIDASVSQGLDARNARADLAWSRTETAGLDLGLLFASALIGGALFIRKAFAQRNRLFSKLQETAARQFAILNNATDAIITLNPSGTIESINRAGRNLFGYDETALSRRDVRKLLELEPQGEDSFLAHLGLSPGPRGSLVLESTGKTADGRRFPAEVALGAMEIEGGGIHVVAIVRDITERRRAEDVKNQFISAVSHELRTPLTSITGSLGLLNGGAVPGLPERAQRLISLAYANSERLGRLVNDILDIEKIESGRMEFTRIPFDIRAVFSKSVEELEGYIAQFGVRVELRGQDAPLWAMGDPDRIGQVAANLISNAAKFSPKGGLVQIGFAVKDAVVQVSVSDNGPGISEDFRAHIFSRFAQADTSDRRQRGGTGLGLAICKQILEQLDGSIFFTTEVGKGARFLVNLPSAIPKSAMVGPSTPVLAPPPARPRVLICEDDQEMGEFLSAIVMAEGGEADLVPSLAQAQVALAAVSYAAMFLDMNLPDGSGLSFLETLAPGPRGHVAPVVMVSAEEARRPRRIGAGAKLVDWVEKPLRPARLRKALLEALQVSADAAHANRPVILHVEDDADVVAVVRDRLSEIAQVINVSSVAAAKHVLATRQPNLIILDTALTDGSSAGLLPFMALQKHARARIIVFSAQETPPELADVDLVLTKSRASLDQLATEVRRLLASPVSAHGPAAEAA